MITEELIKQVQEKPLPDFVTSISLFESDEWDDKKHLEPLIKYLKTVQSGGALIFRTQAFAFVDDLCPNIIEVPQLPHYQNHLYRYLGVFAKARTVACVGSDEPVLHGDLSRCVDTARLFNFDFVGALMESHPHNLIGGRCVFTNPLKHQPLIRQMLEELDLHTRGTSSDWHIDQYFLTDYIRYYPLSVVINAPVGVYKARTIDFLVHRLHTAPTIIVREPNRYDRLY